MKLPPFEDFKKQINFDTLAYDVQRFSCGAFNSPSDLFTQEQFSFLTLACASMSSALLQSYHEWLAETLQSSFNDGEQS